MSAIRITQYFCTFALEMKRTLKYVGVVLLIPIVLLFLVAVLLYLPPIQNWAVRQATAIASEKTGMQISISHVHLRFPLDLGIEGIRVIQPNDSLPQVRDTVADMQTAVVKVRLWPLLDKQIEIDALTLNHFKFNTTNFVKDLRVRGWAQRLHVESHGIDLSKEKLRIDIAELDGAKVDVALADTAAADTSTSENFWKIALEQLSVRQSDVAIHMPGDTLQVALHIDTLEAEKGNFDLFKKEYQLTRVDWMGGIVNYDVRFTPRQKGLDTNHLSLSGIKIGIDSLYYCDPKLALSLRTLGVKEKCGLEVTQMKGNVEMDSVRVILSDFLLQTTESALRANIIMDLNAFSEENPGVVNVKADGEIGKQDLMIALGDMPQDFVRGWPNQPLSMKMVATGNMKHLDFNGLQISLPGALNVHANGYVENLANIDRLKADVNLDAKTYNLGFLTSLAGIDGVKIPRGIGLKGNVKADGSCYKANVALTEGHGMLKAFGEIDTQRMAYSAQLIANGLQLAHFLPDYQMGDFTGKVNIKGNGTNLFSRTATLTADANISKFIFDKYNLDGIKAIVNMRNGRLSADIDANNTLLQGKISLDALMQKKRVDATLAADLIYADLYNLHLVDQPLVTSLCCHVDVSSDLNDYYKVQGLASDVTFQDSSTTYRPEDIVVDILTRRDTTHAIVDCGDFHLNMDASEGYKKLMNAGNNFWNVLSSQMKVKHFNQMALRQTFPDAQIKLNTGQENVFSRMLTRMGYSFERADVDMTSSPTGGLNGRAQLITLVAGSVQLDTIRLRVISDSSQVIWNGQVHNNSKNPQFVFNALFDGYFLERGAGLNVRYYDAKDILGVKLGMEAELEEKGIQLHLLSNDPVIAYKKVHINEDNYLYLADNKRVSAKLDILADDGTGLKLYSNDENTQALQDLTLSLNNFNLEEVLSVMPYMPKITGWMNGDYHFVQEKDRLSVSSSMEVSKLSYEGTYMGNVGTEFVYMPLESGAHYVDGILSVEGEEVGSVKGTYLADNEGTIDATVKLNHLPMALVNGFIPDQLFGLQGYGQGELALKGTLNKPKVNGELSLDSCHLVSVPYGLNLRFCEKPLRIVGSHLLLEDFEMYGYDENPLRLNGNIDFSNLDHITMDNTLRATNFELIKAKENAKSVAFGKAFVNIFGRLQGPLDNLNMRGKLDVLGSTDLSYILRDSPLTTDNQLDELVKFTDFTDTTQTVVTRPPLTGFNMDMTVEVSDGAHVMAYLNADKTNFVDLMGGGTLRMQYNVVDDLRLTGRYTLANGEMKYSLPIIPLKTFTIQDGSFIEFTGDPMNPKLNITATERTKATVSSSNGTGRGVDFDCGVVITKTLNDMGLEFTLDAPEDMTLRNELQQMSKEQRGKLAVTMLTTGMYLADGDTNGFSMNSALSSFLESEINNITGNALRTLDLSIGLDNATDATGAMHTDYSFKFAKRFWNNRLKISVGGKVSTGTDAAYQNENFFDNVTLEYRLDDTANKYVKMFFNNNSYDWLEGYTQEYGAGFVWRRTLQHFKDIFNFRKDSELMPEEKQKNDSIKNEKIN